MPSPEDYARAAMLVDGEGAVTIDSSSNNGRIAISQRKPEAVDWMFTTFGGRRHYQTLRDGRDIHRWHITKSEDLLEFARGIQPYMLIKPQQIALLIQFCSEKLSRGAYNRRTTEQQTADALAAHMMSALNHGWKPVAEA